MQEIATRDYFNGGDSNRHNIAEKFWVKDVFRCFPDFVIRYSDYNETVYKRFITDISTFIYHEVRGQACLSC